uniref:Uncharacterized protein LOC104243096 n=1 Tax=Nicotiana sylvestris TaxID=4096 RepID=A0A1U7XX26_NICSY|nr:PREDICTED: uncharacterized protein LOC104243096 [Nicotiana sylvestris]
MAAARGSRHQKEDEHWRPTADFENLSTITKEDSRELEKPFEEEKILETIRPYAPDKAPGCVYKITAKLLAERIKKVIGKLISGHQNAFIKGRQITDASLIANEVLDWRLKSGESGILCKLDIKKAFDQLNWQYLISMLRKMRFGQSVGKRVKLI